MPLEEKQMNRLVIIISAFLFSASMALADEAPKAPDKATNAQTESAEKSAECKLPQQSKAPEAEFGYELDPYYSNISYTIPLSDSQIPEVYGKDELSIYKTLAKDALLPRFMLVEAAVFPMPLVGVGSKKYLPEFYKVFNVGTSDLNLLEAFTAGFQEPYAATLFFGNVVSFVKEGEEKTCSNRGYLGYMFSYSNQHIKRNVLIPDHSLESELKLKGDRVFKDDKLSWSFRVGAKIHENKDIANTFYIGFRRSNLDFSAPFLSFLENSSFDLRWDFSAKDGRPIRQEYTIGKKIPINRWKIAMKLDVGLIWEDPAKYSGMLRERDFQTIMAVIRPNIEF